MVDNADFSHKKAIASEFILEQLSMSGSNGFPGLLEDDDELVSEAQVRAHHDMAADDDDDESSAGALAENQLDQDDNEQVNFVGLEMPARNHNHGAHRNGDPNENLNNNMMMQMEQHSFAVNGGDGLVGNNNRSSGRRLQQRRQANGGAGEGMGGYLHRRNSGVTTSVSVSAPSVVTKSPCLTWSRIAPSSISGIVPHPRSGAASVIVRNKLYVVSVKDEFCSFFDIVMIFILPGFLFIFRQWLL